MMNSVNAVVQQASYLVQSEGLSVEEAVKKAAGDTEFAADEMGVITNEVNAARAAQQAVQNGVNDTEFAAENNVVSSASFNNQAQTDTEFAAENVNLSGAANVNTRAARNAKQND